MQSDKLNLQGSDSTAGLQIERNGDVLSFTLANPTEGNRVTGAISYDLAVPGKRSAKSSAKSEAVEPLFEDHRRKFAR